MWAFITRQRKIASDDERVLRLLQMRVRDPKNLTATDFALAAKPLDCPPKHLAAFYYVESSGKGSGPDGRLKILFEPHIVSEVTKRALDKTDFDWQWGGQPIKVRLSYPKWQPFTESIRRGSQWHPYKESHQGQWEMLASVYRLHPEALAGASYGGFQILGRNARSLGYGDGERGSHEAACLHMIDDMCDGEKAHLEAALRFLKVNGLVEALRRGDWETLARGYNGSGQVQVFAAKLEREANRQRQVFV